MSLPIYADPSDFEQVDGTWRRHGTCNRCGQCCRSGDPFNGEHGEPAVEGACPFYREENGLGACSERTEANTYYANGCVHWPNHPSQITDYNLCSYTFEKIA